MQVSVKEINVKEGRRRLDADHVGELADSIRELGLLNPVTIDKENNLIAGLHRLEAAKLLGWENVECTVSSLDGLRAELAEIDENIIRSGLPAIEYGEMLLRRKEIYESIHPETRHGGDRKSGEIKCAKSTLDTAKSFVDDTADKLKVNPCTVRRQLQTARNLTPEAREVMKKADMKISKKAAMKLSRLEPFQQKEAAELLAVQKIKTVDEYVTGYGNVATEGKLLPEQKKENMRSGPENQDMERERQEEGSINFTRTEEDILDETLRRQQDIFPDTGELPAAGSTSLKDIIAQLKDPDKDCSGTPDSFLAEYGAFVQKFHREIEWYGNSYYDAAYASINGQQLELLRRMTDYICAAAEAMFSRVEQMRKS